ncbi:ADP-ribose pyrophosphatase, mitochondrial [Strongylocentrotus purpuratus]|uniref:Nudix hydrolase domain-containing protein n=1 Tax=Strongylocentrotus purpuratus TaxID=7668 RepID=A0A7M7HP82_STRPU|nr:ADP-ribose pyrophosphatase, mitochondrial [Strongylocentrotus purpuratus]
MKTQRNTRAMAKRQQPKDCRKRPVKVTQSLTGDIVVAAITALRNANGSSAQSIKNYIKTIHGDIGETPSLGRALKAASRRGEIELVAAGGGLLTYKLAKKGKSKTLRARGAAKKKPRATSAMPKTRSEMLATKKQAEDANKPAKKGIKKVCKGPTALKATPSKKASAKKTTKGAPKKQGARKPLKKATKKRDDEETSSDSRENLFSSVGLCGHYFHLPKVTRGGSSSITPATMIHTKARHTIYPNSTVGRLPVPDDKVPWKVEWLEYSPVKYTSDHVKAGPVWADPDIMQKGSPSLNFNSKDGKVNRRSYIGDYGCVDGVPRNPCGRTGMMERGLLGKWGPNHAADPIVTRWKRDSSGKKVLHPTSGKPILQFISIRRKDSGEWAIPGGMVDAGEKVSQALKREFGEEAMNSLSLQDKECKAVEKAVANLFKHGVEVYRGYVDDPRNTDNAWMETMAVNFHDDQGTSVAKFSLHAGDDAAAVQWHDVGSEMKLYASHSSFIEMVTKRVGAHW